MIYWFYDLGAKRGGPVSLEKLIALTTNGTIRPDTLLWNLEMPDWLKASDMPELALPFVDTPSVEPAPSRDPSVAGPWPRFWARMIDIYVLNYALSYALTYVTSLYTPAFYLRMMATNTAVITLALFPFVILLLVLMMSVTGTTIGKAAVGISVENRSGRSSPLFYLLREFRIWVFGYAFGIPILNLIAFAIQSRILKRKGATGYDRDFAIVRRRSSSGHYAVGVVLALAVMASIHYENFSQRYAALRHGDGIRTWTNPLTGKRADFPYPWTYKELKSDTENVYHFFSERSLTEILLGYQPLGRLGVDPIAYGEALQEALEDNFTFEGRWEADKIDGFDAARIVALQKGVGETHVEITVVVMGQSAWRLLFFARGQPLENIIARGIWVRSLLSSGKDINVPTNMPCEGPHCLSLLASPAVPAS